MTSYEPRPKRPCIGCGRYLTAGQFGYCARTDECRRASARLSVQAVRQQRKRQLRERLAQHQGGTCSECSLPLPEDVMSDEIEVDHIIPRAIVAIDEDWNLRLAHTRCNAAKWCRVTAEAIELAIAHGVDLLAGLAAQHRYPPRREVELRQALDDYATTARRSS